MAVPRQYLRDARPRARASRLTYGILLHGIPLGAIDQVIVLRVVVLIEDIDGHTAAQRPDGELYSKQRVILNSFN